MYIINNLAVNACVRNKSNCDIVAILLFFILLISVFRKCIEFGEFMLPKGAFNIARLCMYSFKLKFMPNAETILKHTHVGIY